MKEEEKVGINLAVNRKVRQEFKMLAALEEIKMQDLFIKMLEMYKLKRNES